MSLKQQALLGVFWSGIEKWGGQLISTLVFLLLARILGPKDFGLVALASTFLSFMQIFLDQGFSQAIVQRQELTDEHLDTAFWSNLLIALILFIIIILASGQVAAFFKEPQLALILCWMAPNFIFGGLNGVQSALLQRKLNFKVLAMRRLAGTAVGGIVGITLAVLGFGVWSLVAKQIADSITAVLLLWSTSDWRPSAKFSPDHFRELFSYGINVVGINFLNYLNRNSDNLLIGYFLGSTILGYYSVAYRLLLITTEIMIGTIQKIAMPVFSRMQEDKNRLRNAFYQAIKLTSLFAFPVYIGMSLLSPELIQIVFGDDWVSAASVMRILSLVGPLYAGFYYNGPLIMACGKPSWNLLLNFFQAIGNLIVFSVAVQWGIVAVAAAYVIRGYLMSPIAVWMVQKLIKIELKVYMNQYIVPALGSLMLTITMLTFQAFLPDYADPKVILFGSAILGGISYLTFVWLAAPQLIHEVVSIVRPLYRKNA